jgi:ribosomal protein L7Ae-like RNA K-turn-binding protein
VDAARAAKVAGLLGLGLRARTVVVGVELVKGAVKSGKAKLVFVAPDASPHSQDKLVPLLKARRTAWYDALDAHALGAAVGRETVSAIGVTDPALAKGIRQVLDAGAAMARDDGGTGRSR